MAMLIGTSAADVARALTRIAKRKVVYVSSVGDAASPVWLVAGGYSAQIGQCADWRHHVSHAAEQNNALYVEGSYDDGRWLVGVADRYAAELCAELKVITVAQERSNEEYRARRMRETMARREAERPAREARAAEYRAECAARAAEYRPLYDAARAKVRTTSKGAAHKGDMRDLEYAYGKACGTVDCYGEYDRQHGLRLLTRLSEHGFVDAVTA